MVNREQRTQKMFSETVLLVTVMLVTSLCWWLYDGDWILMLQDDGEESLCWRLFPLCWWFPQCIKSVTNILNRSSTSQTCQQHIWSPTPFTNIDVARSFLICSNQISHAGIIFNADSIFLSRIADTWTLTFSRDKSPNPSNNCVKMRLKLRKIDA